MDIAQLRNEQALKQKLDFEHIVSHMYDLYLIWKQCSHSNLRPLGGCTVPSNMCSSGVDHGKRPALRIHLSTSTACLKKTKLSSLYAFRRQVLQPTNTTSTAEA